MHEKPEAAAHTDDLYTRPAYITGIQSFLDEADHARALGYWLTEFVARDRLRQPRDIILAIQHSIGEIDHLINEQVNAIMHHPRLQKLEASWRGLWFLAQQADGASNVKLKLLDASWAEVSRDISRALEFDQSQLFKKIYSEEYGTPGGEPYGVIIGDYEISHKSTTAQGYNDVDTLTGLAQISAASFAPFIAAASPRLFGLDDFSALGQPLDLHNLFAQQEYIPWLSFRAKTDTQFVGLVLPRILMRLPYRKTPGSFRGLFFYEHCEVLEHYCWGNAAYGFAAILIREFAAVGWFGHIRGVPRNQIGGGLLTSLPCDSFESDAEDIAPKPVTEVIVTDRRERELAELGLIACCQCYDTPFAAFYSNPSLRKTGSYESRETEVNMKLSAMLQHVLCGSRIAHYVKVIIRDKVGSFITAEECEDFLREWLFKYTTGREDLAWEEQAQYPLRESAVSVRNHPEKPGDYICIIHLRPHYQLDNMVSELELVTELAQSA